MNDAWRESMNGFFNTIVNIFGLVLSTAILTNTAQAAQIDFSGSTQAAILTNIPWVGTSTMWGTVEAATGTGVAATGLSSLSGLELSKFTFTFGDLELTDYESPGPTTAGFELYSENDSSTQPIIFFYNGTQWASGSLNYLRIDVDSIFDLAAVGSATANLTSATPAGAAFFNEVMLLTGGSGLLTINVDGFFPINDAGNFNTTGTIVITQVPSPPTIWLFLSGLSGLIGIARRDRAA